MQVIPGLLKHQGNYFEPSSNPGDFRKSEKIFLSLQDNKGLFKHQESPFEPSSNPEDFKESYRNTLKLARHFRTCQTSINLF